MMSPNVCCGSVLALLSVRLNEPGVRPVAVKAKAVPLGASACLMTVTCAGKMTASAESERSWLPPEPSRSRRRLWYGEPEMEIAELPAPHAWRVAMCPAQASTGLATLAVNVITMLADLSPVKPVPVEYEYVLTLVIVPP